MSAEGIVQIKVKEYYKISDILLENLSTTTKNDILETGGMVYIEAIANGEKCKLKNQATVDIAFPYKTKKDGMSLFFGTWNNSKIVWGPMQINSALSPTYHPNEVAELSFPGGEEALIGYFKKNVRYPSYEKENTIEGTVNAAFVINEMGKVEDVNILEGYKKEPGLVTETIRLIKSMPLWNPGRKNGKKVRVQFNLPLKFILKDGGTVVFGNSYNSVDIIYSKRKIVREVNEENLKNVSIVEIGNYLFVSSNLGWLNCDRSRLFANNKSPRINYSIQLSEKNNIDVKIVFSSIKSVMAAFVNGTQYCFPNVPSGEKITIVALKYENGTPSVAIKESTISNIVEASLVFETVTMEKLKSTIEKLNKLD